MEQVTEEPENLTRFAEDSPYVFYHLHPEMFWDEVPVVWWKRPLYWPRRAWYWMRARRAN